MRRAHAARRTGALLVALGAILPVSAAAEQETLTAERAVELALERNLELRAAEVEAELAEARLTGAEVLSPHNPEISGGAGARFSGGEAGVEAEAGLSQTFELAGQRGRRITAARAGLRAARDRLEHDRLRVAAEARRAFLRAVTARVLVELAREAEALTNDLHRIAQERLEAEAGTELEVNLAALEWLGAQRRLRRAIRREREARLELARALVLPPDEEVRLPASLPPARAVTAEPGELVRLALERRLDLAALDEQRRAAAAEIEVVRAEAAPDLRVGATYAFEDGGDHIVTLGLSLPLPLFQRNQGEIAAARARAELAEVALEHARRAVEREVRAAVERLRAAREEGELLGREALRRVSRNLELLRASFEEGEVGLVEVLLVQRDLIATRRDAAEAELELRLARIELELTVGGEVE